MYVTDVVSMYIFILVRMYGCVDMWMCICVYMYFTDVVSMYVFILVCMYGCMYVWRFTA